MSYNITGTTITLTRGDTFEALVSATKRDGTQYIPVEGDSIRFAMKENYDDPRPLAHWKLTRSFIYTCWREYGL